MQRLDGALPTLTQLRQSGVGLAIDDFGTGYSSLRHLSSLPVDALKIDRGFVADLRARQQRGRRWCAPIVLMGQSLGKTVMAEGIESAAQLMQLQQAGCRAGQGFFLSPPLRAAEVDVWLTRLPGDGLGSLSTHADTRASLFH